MEILLSVAVLVCCLIAIVTGISIALIKGYEYMQNIKYKIKSKPSIRDSIVKLGADIVEEVEKRKSK